MQRHNVPPEVRGQSQNQIQPPPDQRHPHPDFVAGEPEPLRQNFCSRNQQNVEAKHREDETFQLLKGEYEWTVGGKTFIAKKGATFFVRRPRSQDWRIVPDYEREGRRFYRLATREIEPPGPASVFEKLAEKFTLAREALNTLSDCYLKPIRARYFDQPDGV